MRKETRFYKILQQSVLDGDREPLDSGSSLAPPIPSGAGRTRREALGRPNHVGLEHHLRARRHAHQQGLFGGLERRNSVA